MIRRTTVFRSGALVALVAAVSMAFVMPVQDAGERPGAATPEEIVGAMAGTWDITVKGMSPEPIPGTSVIRLIGTRWAIEEVDSTMGGQPFTGHSINGFDAEKGRFVGYWVDNSSPKVHESTSTWDEASRTLVSDPAEEMGPTGETMKVIGRFRQVDADHWVYTQSPADDASVALWSVEYARKQ